MTEQRLGRRPQTAAARAPGGRRAMIEIHWGKAVAGTVKVRHCPVEAATKAGLIHWKAGCRPTYESRPALVAPAQFVFASRPAKRAQRRDIGSSWPGACHSEFVVHAPLPEPPHLMLGWFGNPPSWGKHPTVSPVIPFAFAPAPQYYQVMKSVPKTSGWRPGHK